MKAQDKLELGALLGASYYLGDLNPNQQFKMSRPAIGFVGRYAISDRIAVKADVLFVNIAGEYPSQGDKYPTTYNNDDVSYKFKRHFVEVGAMGELNFCSYDHPFMQRKLQWTPYLTLGVAVFSYKRFVEDDYGEMGVGFALPFGLGVKYKVNKWLRLGFEWSWRKTFQDDLDLTCAKREAEINPADPYKTGAYAITHNNDWYTFCGVSVTLSMWPRKLACNDGLKSINK